MPWFKLTVPDEQPVSRATLGPWMSKKWEIRFAYMAVPVPGIKLGVNCSGSLMRES